MNIELPLYSQVLMILINFVVFWLVFISCKYIFIKKIRRIFLASIFFMFCWVNFSYLARLIGQQLPETGLTFLRIAWWASPLLFVTIYFFSVIYLNKEKEYLILNKIILILSIIASLIAGFTDLIINDIRFIDIDLSIVYGGGMIPFLGLVFFIMCINLYILFKEYIKSPPEKKIRIEYLLAGILIFYIANLIFGIIFPIFLKFASLYWIGDYSSIVLLGFIAYAIVKRELFGVKVIIAQFFSILIAALLSVQTILSISFERRILNGGILIAFLFFGYYLIKAVKEDEKRRKKAEEIAIKEKELRERAELVIIKEKKLREEAERITSEFKRLDEAKNQFMLATQHHLRTPLTSMRGYLDLIFGGTYGKVPKRLEETLQRFKISTSRLIRTVNEFLDISQFQLNRDVVFLRPGVRVNKILEEMVEDLTFQAKDKGIYLKLKKPKNFPEIFADNEKLKAALYNIADNAIKYTREGGLSIKVEIIDSKIRIIFKDTGMGIEKEEKENLFNRFFERGDLAKKVFTTGRGIGLYLAYKIIEAHKGKLWVESEGKDKGSTFFVELPIK